MRNRFGSLGLKIWPSLIAITAAAVMVGGSPVRAETLDELIGAVVKIKTQINPEGTTVRGLGRDREGSGILIDADGLVLTIGYIKIGRAHV